MKVILTGASGFIGTNYKSYTRLGKPYEVDLLFKEPGDYDFHGFDTVVHLAALVHQMKGANEEDYFKVNTDLAYNTALHAKASGVGHFILLSTVKVYGEKNTGQQPLNELSICTPAEPYGMSKLMAEQKLSSLQDGSFLVSIIRSPLVYGPGVKGNIHNLLKMADSFKFVPLGNITNHRSMVSVKNLSAYIDRIAILKEPGVFLALDGEAVSTSDLIREIISCFREKKYLLPLPSAVQTIVKLFQPSFYDRLLGNLQFENNHTKSVLKLKVPQSFKEGVREMVNWYTGSKQAVK